MEPFSPLVLPQDNKTEIRTNITTQIYDFSKEVPAKIETKKLIQGKEFDKLVLQCTIFKNGFPFPENDTKLQNRGYVTFEIYIDFKLKPKFSYYETYLLVCFVSVIDNASHKRFTRTFSEEYDTNNQIDWYVPFILFDKYISRKTLLGDTTELLQNDILTIDVDVTFVLEYSSEESKRLQNKKMKKWLRLFTPIHPSDSHLKYCLSLNSPEMTNTLCEVSTFFRDFFAYTVEDESEFLDIPIEDVRSLTMIFMIVKWGKYEVETITDDIFELLRVSDKYDVLNLPEICRQFIKEFLYSDKLSSFLLNNNEFLGKLMQLAQECRDTTVLEQVEAFVKTSEPNFEFQDNCSDISKGNFKTKEIISELKWTYKPSFGFALTKNSNDSEEDHSYFYCN